MKSQLAILEKASLPKSSNEEKKKYTFGDKTLIAVNTIEGGVTKKSVVVL